MTTREDGSASIWVVACCALLMVLGGVGTVRAAAVLARHRVESAADLSAVAAAGELGTGREPCPAAAWVARRNGAALASCVVHLDAGGRSGVVDVVVRVDVRLPVVGRESVRASARAGRRALSAASGLAASVLWHAGSRPSSGAPARSRRGRAMTYRKVNAWRSPSPGTLPTMSRWWR